MASTHDVAVVGLGIMGSAIAYQCAKRNLSVLGLERWWSIHDLSSSHGHTRLFRQAHFEHSDYVPLARSAFEGWREIEELCNRQLFLNTGALVIGSPSGGIVEGARTAADEHRVPYDYLAADSLRERFPWLRSSPKEVGLLERSAGVLLSQDCVGSFQEAAVRLGAELRFGTECELSASSSGRVELTANGRAIPAKHVIVAAGPWTSQVLPRNWIPPLTVERTLSFWFRPKLARVDFDVQRFPVIVWDHPLRPMLIFPSTSELGIKVNFEENGQAIDPENLDRMVAIREIEQARFQLATAAPTLAGELTTAKACMYTNTRDGHFAIGHVGGGEGALLVSACSGHGFKFAPVVGEIVADLVVEGSTRHANTLFRLDRGALYPQSEINDILRPANVTPGTALTERRRR